MKVTPLVASTFYSDGGAMFGLVPKPIWAKLITPNERNGIPQNANSLLIELADGRRGLVDTGCGPASAFTERECKVHGLSEGWPLMDALSALGLAPADIDFVILSHLHWDHAGGAALGEQGATFPSATHYVHAYEWDAATSGDPLLFRSYPAEVMEPLKRSRGAFTLLDDDNSEVAPGLRLVRSGGHTDGHCTVVCDGPELELVHPQADRFTGVTRMIFAADVCPTRHHLRLVYQTAYDTAPLDTRAWKMRTLPEVAEDGALLLFDHDPDCFGATIRPDEKREFVVVEKLPVLR